MKQVKLEIEMEFCSMDELSVDEQTVVKCACAATRNSYANYSHFHVGAAVMLDNGKVVIGANQENAAYPSGLCAERTAIFSAQTNYPDQPVRLLAIAASDVNGLRDKPVTPCGACRQVILEVEERYNKPIEILLYGTTGVYRIKSVKDLLPLCFVENDMR